MKLSRMILTLLIFLGSNFSGVAQQEKDSVLPENFWLEGIRNERQGTLEKARAAYQRALINLPENTELNNRLARTYERLAQWDQALKSYEVSLRINSVDTLALNGKGRILRNQKKFEIAESLFLKAIASNLTQPESYLNLASLYQDQGRIMDSFGVLIQLSTILPQHALTYYKLGQFYESEGYLSEAIQSYQQFLRFSRDASLKWKIRRHLKLLVSED